MRRGGADTARSRSPSCWSFEFDPAVDESVLLTPARVRVCRGPDEPGRANSLLLCSPLGAQRPWSRVPASRCLHGRALKSLGVDPGWARVPVASRRWEQEPQLSGALLAHGVPAAVAEAEGPGAWLLVLPRHRMLCEFSRSARTRGEGHASRLRSQIELGVVPSPRS